VTAFVEGVVGPYPFGRSAIPARAPG
jgi:hypothetical protein